MAFKDMLKLDSGWDLYRLIIFFIVSPFIGILMTIGLIGTSVAMICMFLNEKNKEKLYE